MLLVIGMALSLGGFYLAAAPFGVAGAVLLTVGLLSVMRTHGTDELTR